MQSICPPSAFVADTVTGTGMGLAAPRRGVVRLLYFEGQPGGPAPHFDALVATSGPLSQPLLPSHLALRYDAITRVPRVAPSHESRLEVQVVKACEREKQVRAMAGSLAASGAVTSGSTSDPSGASLSAPEPLAVVPQAAPVEHAAPELVLLGAFTCRISRR